MFMCVGSEVTGMKPDEDYEEDMRILYTIRIIRESEVRCLSATLRNFYPITCQEYALA